MQGHGGRAFHPATVECVSKRNHARYPCTSAHPSAEAATPTSQCEEHSVVIGRGRFRLHAGFHVGQGSSAPADPPYDGAKSLFTTIPDSARQGTVFIWPTEAGVGSPDLVYRRLI